MMVSSIDDQIMVTHEMVLVTAGKVTSSEEGSLKLKNQEIKDSDGTPIYESSDTNESVS